MHYSKNLNIDMIKGWKLLRDENLSRQKAENGNFEKIGTDIVDHIPWEPYPLVIIIIHLM